MRAHHDNLGVWAARLRLTVETTAGPMTLVAWRQNRALGRIGHRWTRVDIDDVTLTEDQVRQCRSARAVALQDAAARRVA